MSASPDPTDALREVIRTIIREELGDALADLRASGSASENAPVGPRGEYVDDRELAAWLGMSRETVQQWRGRGEGPPFLKVQRAVRYHVPTVRAWLASQQRGR